VFSAHRKLYGSTPNLGVSLLAMTPVNTPLKQNPLLETQVADFLYGNE